MPENTQHARPPRVADEVYGALMQAAEAHPAARMVVMHDPETNVTLIATVEAGQVVYWNLLAPMTDEATRACLAGEVERGHATQDEIVYLQMAEVAPENARLN